MRFVIDLPIHSDHSPSSARIPGRAVGSSLREPSVSIADSNYVPLTAQASIRSCYRKSSRQVNVGNDASESQSVVIELPPDGYCNQDSTGMDSIRSSEESKKDVNAVDATRVEDSQPPTKRRLRAWSSLESLVSQFSASPRLSRTLSQSEERPLNSPRQERHAERLVDLVVGDRIRVTETIQERSTSPRALQGNGSDKLNGERSCRRASRLPPRLSMERTLRLEGKKALIVDDVLSNRKVLLRHMRNVFGHIDEAEDGVQAVNCVKRAAEQGSPYDVIFMDFVMPNMDGPTATAEIRSMGFKGPIFGVTGNALTSDIQLFIERGANGVFLKPVDMVSVDRALKGNTSTEYRAPYILF